MEENMKTTGSKGILIVFEGISGCGKSENVEHIRNWLAHKGYKVGVLEWNSNRFIRRIVDKISAFRLLTPEVYSFFQWLSFILDYFSIIHPQLKKNYILIADRYIYTGLTRDSANGASGRLGKILYKKIIKPDLTFFLDVSPKECYKRIQKRGKTLFYTNKMIRESTIIKNKDLFYLMKLRKEYLHLFSDHNVKNNTQIIWVSNNKDIVKRCIGNYLAGKMEVSEYVKSLN